jgi:hypothetical protein
MGIDIEVGYGKSHVDRSLQMTGKRTGISPFFEELIIEVDPLLDLGKISFPPHFPKEFSFEEFEWFTLLKIGAGLNGPDPKTEFRESVTISIGDGKRNLPLHCYFPFNYRGSKPLGYSMVIAFLPLQKIDKGLSLSF